MARQFRLASFFLLALLLVVSVVDIDAKKRGGSFGSSGWGTSSKRGSSSKPQSKPQPSHSSSGGSQPGTIGWNVPNNNRGGSASSTVPKASAPSEHITRTGASNVNSGYPGSGQHYGGNPPPYSSGGGYHQPSGGYNPSAGYHPSSGGYHPSSGGYNPSGGYHAPSGAGYHPNGGYTPYGNAGHGYSNTPGAGYNPSYGSAGVSHAQPAQTILVQQSSRPGIGQLAKEAFVFAGVSAGVNAAVNRLLPGGIYGHSPSYGASSSGVVPPVTHTQITYNNYYNNGSSAPAQDAGVNPANVPAPAYLQTGPPSNGAAEPVTAAPSASGRPDNAPAPAAAPAAAPAPGQPQQPPAQPQYPPSPSGAIITDADLEALSEDLFKQDSNNAMKHIVMKIQGRKTDDSSTDDAPENLLEVKPEAYEIPTVKAVLALHDNYELDVKTKETVSSEERKEESDLLDAFLTTDVMKAAMKFLSDKGYVPNDEYEFKDSLKRIWFSQFKRMEGEPTSSGFETVFLAEKFDNEIIGLHNWIYFAKQEEAKNLNYLGFIKMAEFGSNGAIVKGRSKLNDIVQPITSIFVGTSPELEMALYTICFYVRPNDACPLQMGGSKFLVVANRVNYFGKDIIISAFPDV
ncbi:poly(U)-specific endoribonuclease homolog [Trichogramma pretiosum]|uniref:poly(U)-specific endoribonuclease homolog n=1 Tax=Trichogramma pretiosum TaxID=7493 RepID=UPI0006C9CA2F|nr:poly(U)-specific endoribonuclease homolog [Trichogramma pretiosum]